MKNIHDFSEPISTSKHYVYWLIIYSLYRFRLFLDKFLFGGIECGVIKFAIPIHPSSLRIIPAL